MRNYSRYIVKINTSTLKKHNWNIDKSEINDNWYVAISESQITRWIDDLKGFHPVKKRGKKIRLKDLCSVVMDSDDDYDRANDGFTIGSVNYKRLMGTPGGIKTGSILYINEKYHEEIMRRVSCGRDTTIPLVPAKLEAYQALTCSGSVPLDRVPRMIVVPDCFTDFTEQVTEIYPGDDGGDPVIKDNPAFENHHDNSDGFGLMSPVFAAEINRTIHGTDEPISAVVVRYAWTKGTLATFDFVEFAERIAGKYTVTDVWGDERDIRDADVILTESMLKLWKCYNNMEHWREEADKSGFQFSITKTAPLQLEEERTLNYQFVQSFDFSDEDINALCKPTIDLVNDVKGGDVLKSILFKGGVNLTVESVGKALRKEEKTDDTATSDKSDFYEAIAMMVDPRTVTDPQISYSIKRGIAKTIDDAALGKLYLRANYAIIIGDPYALCQSMFGLDVTGLLKADEVYHDHWRLRDAEKVACFRAPMTSMPQVCIRDVSNNDDAVYWFRHCRTIVIFNAFDSTFERLSGADADGDICYTTNDKTILDNVIDLPRLCPVQKTAEKKIVTENDIIESTKIGFRANVGAICNKITSMFDVQAGFEKGSWEWETLNERITTGQLFIQDSIDSVKGITPSVMPDRWFNRHNKDISDSDRAICASRKPYFMRYRYAEVDRDFRNYYAKLDSNAIRAFRTNLESLIQSTDRNAAMQDYINNYFRFCPVTLGNCTINRISRYIENQLVHKAVKYANYNFDYSVYKYGVEYTNTQYKKIAAKFDKYLDDVADFKKRKLEMVDDEIEDDEETDKQKLDAYFNLLVNDCLDIVDGDEDKLNDIVVDICYTTPKQKYFAWKIAGRTMILALLRKNDNRITIPVQSEDGDILFKGKRLKEKQYELLF